MERPVTRRRALQLGTTASVGLLAGLAGCGSDSTDETTTGPSDDTETDGDSGAGPDAVPAGADAVVRVDVATMVESDLFAQSLSETLSTIQENASGYEGPTSAEQVMLGVEQMAGLDPADLSEMTVFWSNEEGGDQAGALLTADWAAEDIVAAAEQQTGASVSESTYAGTTLYDLNGMTLGVLGDGRYAVGSRAAVEAVVDTDAGEADAVGGTVAEAFANAPEGPMRFGADVAEVPMASGDSGPVDMSALNSVESVSGGLVNEGDTWTFSADFSTASSEDATAVADAMSGLLSYAREELASDDQVQQLIDDPTAQLDAVSIGESGSTATLTYSGSTDLVAGGGMLVVLAAVASFALPLGQSRQQYTPAAVFQFDYEAGEATITHEGGDSIPADRLVIQTTERRATWAALSSRLGASEDVTAGESVTLAVDGGTEVLVVYEGEGTSAVLSMFETPDA